MQIELKHPIVIKKQGKVTKEIKMIESERLKVKHFKLLPAELIEKMTAEEGKDFTKVGLSELLPIFTDLLPFIGGIFNLSKEETNEIDFDDIEAVVDSLGEIFSEKK